LPVFELFLLRSGEPKSPDCLFFAETDKFSTTVFSMSISLFRQYSLSRFSLASRNFCFNGKNLGFAGGGERGELGGGGKGGYYILKKPPKIFGPVWVRL
jgi:hypothetical protein